MDPITLAIVAFVGIATVTVIAVSINKLISWFRARGAISAEDRSKLGVVVAARLNSRDYARVPGVFSKSSETQLVQAIYDPGTGEILDARAVSSGHVNDASLVENIERGDGMIVFG